MSLVSLAAWCTDVWFTGFIADLKVSIPMSLTDSAIAGARWTAISSIVNTLVQLGQLAVLARLLQPSDFGLMAMVSLVLSFISIYADMGINNAIIQRQDATREELSSLYLLNILAGCLAFIVMIVATPFAVAIYGEPRLDPLLRASAVVLLIGPFGTQFLVLLQKSLRFKTLAKMEIARAITVATTTVAAAFGGMGVFSLVIGTIFGTLVFTLLLMSVGWRLWQPTFKFGLTDLLGYVKFGLFQMGDSTLNFFCSRADQLMIGAFLGAEILGFYSVASNLTLLPSYRINPIFTRVAFPIFARVQGDTDRLKRGYMTMLRIVIVICAPILLGLAVTAPALIPQLYGAQWTPAIPLVQILSVVGLLYVIGNPIGTLLLSRGRADVAFWWTLISTAMQVPGIYIGLHLGGPIGVALVIIGMNLVFRVGEYWLIIRKILGPCLGLYLQNVFAPVLVAAAMAAFVWTIPYLIPAGQALELGIQIVAGTAAYLILSLLFQRAWLLRSLETLGFKSDEG